MGCNAENPKKTKKCEKKCEIFFAEPLFSCQNGQFCTLFYKAGS
jgi:hypothetical protein